MAENVKLKSFAKSSLFTYFVHFNNSCFCFVGQHLPQQNCIHCREAQHVVKCLHCSRRFLFINFKLELSEKYVVKQYQRKCLISKLKFQFQCNISCVLIQKGTSLINNKHHYMGAIILRNRILIYFIYLPNT